MQRITLPAAALRLGVQRGTIDRLIRKNVLPLPQEEVPRGWNVEDWPAVAAAAKAHETQYKSAQLAGLKKAVAARRAAKAAKVAKAA